MRALIERFSHLMVNLIREIISNIFLPKIQEPDLHDMWFQQDGATWHTARETMDLLRGEFGDYFNSRSGLDEVA